MDCQYSGQLNHKFPFLFVFFLHSTYVLCMYICVGCFTKAFLCSNYFTCIDNVYDFCQKIQALLVSKRSGSFARSFQKKFKQLLQPWRLNYMILGLNESMKIFFWLTTPLQFVPLNLPGQPTSEPVRLLARQVWWNYMILCIWPKKIFIN